MHARCARIPKYRSSILKHNGVRRRTRSSFPLVRLAVRHPIPRHPSRPVLELTVGPHPPMSSQRGHLPNMSNQLRDPGSKRLGVLSFCASVFPKLSPFCASFAHAQYGGRGVLGGRGQSCKKQFISCSPLREPSATVSLSHRGLAFYSASIGNNVFERQKPDPIIRFPCVR